jgi:DNA-binding MarR family transcriptional regulator
LLDLDANGGEEGMMVSSLCHAACVPPTTALRYVYKLVEAGNLVCEDHPQDQRRTMVRMAPHMPEKMEQILSILRNAI